MQYGIEALQRVAVRPTPDQLRVDIQNAKQGNAEAQLSVCGALVWAAFAAPAAITGVFDRLSDVYIGDTDIEPGPTDAPEADLPDSFWQAFESILIGPEAGYDASSITAAVASLGGAVAPRFHELVESAARQHPGNAGAAEKSMPPMIDLDALSGLPEGSLGADLYTMLVENGYDAEVLDREAIGLENLSPAARYLNTRILQMHDVWHLVAGYQTTSMHEIAISSFQLAQFGHNYSAMFLATVGVMSQNNGPDAFNLMMQIISESWVHGRQSPPFMAIPFESEWGNSIELIRSKYGVSAFQGSFPANLFETMRASA